MKKIESNTGVDFEQTNIYLLLEKEIVSLDLFSRYKELTVNSINDVRQSAWSQLLDDHLLVVKDIFNHSEDLLVSCCQVMLSKEQNAHLGKINDLLERQSSAAIGSSNAPQKIEDNSGVEGHKGNTVITVMRKD